MLTEAEKYEIDETCLDFLAKRLTDEGAAHLLNQLIDYGIDYLWQKVGNPSRLMMGWIRGTINEGTHWAVRDRHTQRKSPSLRKSPTEKSNSPSATHKDQSQPPLRKMNSPTPMRKSQSPTTITPTFKTVAPRPQQRRAATATAVSLPKSVPSKKPMEWICASCTFANGTDCRVCEMCQEPPRLAPEWELPKKKKRQMRPGTPQGQGKGRRL
jgi:hypothetical protein